MRYLVTLLCACSFSVFAQPNNAAPSYPSPPPNPQAYQQPAPHYQAPPRGYYPPQQSRRQAAPRYQAPPPNYYPPQQAYRQAPPYYQAPPHGYYPPQGYNPRGYYPPRDYYPRKRKKKKSRFGFGSFNPSNPKKSMSKMWDDGWKEPGSWGRMPGGWTFPDISLPNPVDSADDFQKGIKDIPKGFDFDN